MHYDYDFSKNNEHVVEELNNILVSFDDTTYECNIIKTDKKILFFVDDSKNVLKNSSITLLAKNKLIHAIDLQELDYKLHDNNTIINFQGHEIIIYDYQL